LYYYIVFTDVYKFIV